MQELILSIITHHNKCINSCLHQYWQSGFFYSITYFIIKLLKWDLFIYMCRWTCETCFTWKWSQGKYKSEPPWTNPHRRVHHLFSLRISLKYISLQAYLSVCVLQKMSLSGMMITACCAVVTGRTAALMTLICLSWTGVSFFTPTRKWENVSCTDEPENGVVCKTSKCTLQSYFSTVAPSAIWPIITLKLNFSFFILHCF